MSRPDGAEGFSLVETLVALAVIAAMCAMLFEAIGASARASEQLAERRAAVLLARSLLAQAAIPPGAGRLEAAGRAQGLAWRFARRPVGGGARDTGRALEEIRIEVLDAASGQRLTSVRTLRLVQ